MSVRPRWTVQRVKKTYGIQITPTLKTAQGLKWCHICRDATFMHWGSVVPKSSLPKPNVLFYHSLVFGVPYWIGLLMFKDTRHISRETIYSLKQGGQYCVETRKSLAHPAPFFDRLVTHPVDAGYARLSRLIKRFGPQTTELSIWSLPSRHLLRCCCGIENADGDVVVPGVCADESSLL